MTSLSNTVHGCYPEDFLIGDGQKVWIRGLPIPKETAIALLVSADKKLKIRPPAGPEYKFMDKAFTVVGVEPEVVKAVYKEGASWYTLEAYRSALLEWRMENEETPFAEFLEKML